MMRFMLAATTLSYALTTVALSADVPVNSKSAQPAAANLNGVYVKMLLPDAPGAPVVEGDSTIESWIIQGIDEDRRRVNYRAVTGWVRLVEGPFEGTHVCSGVTLDGVGLCPVGGESIEREDSWVKIKFHGWSPGGAFAKVALPDEPGSRVVVPVNEAKLKHGIPHLAIFVGVPDK